MSKKKIRGDFGGGACDAVGMVRNEKKGKIFPKKSTGGRVWGECWEIKDKIGEKNFRGPEILGGWGNAKKGGKTFLGECWGM